MRCMAVVALFQWRAEILGCLARGAACECFDTKEAWRLWPLLSGSTPKFSQLFLIPWWTIPGKFPQNLSINFWVMFLTDGHENREVIKTIKNLPYTVCLCKYFMLHDILQLIVYSASANICTKIIFFSYSAGFRCAQKSENYNSIWWSDWHYLIVFLFDCLDPIRIYLT